MQQINTERQPDTGRASLQCHYLYYNCLCTTACSYVFNKIKIALHFYSRTSLVPLFWHKSFRYLTRILDLFRWDLTNWNHRSFFYFTSYLLTLQNQDENNNWSGLCNFLIRHNYLEIKIPDLGPRLMQRLNSWDRVYSMLNESGLTLNWASSRCRNC